VEWLHEIQITVFLQDGYLHVYAIGEDGGSTRTERYALCTLAEFHH
jgi:hypothetical protein